MYRVLLVEDEEIIRKGIRYSVPWEEYGCSVVAEAENGAVGEEKIAELRPDIVITDITMPVKSGLEMIADTREEYKYIAIILTGYSEFEYAQQAIRNGVSDYVLKPLDMDEMGAALEKAVRLAGDSQYLQKREDEAEDGRRRAAPPPPWEPSPPPMYEYTLERVVCNTHQTCPVPTVPFSILQIFRRDFPDRHS